MQFRDNAPFMPQGIEPQEIVFASSRLGVAMAKHGGLTKICYFGRQRFSGIKLYTADPLSPWTKLFRLYVVIDDRVYYPEFTKTTTYPFGYTSEVAVEDVQLIHEMTLLDNALVFRITVRENPRAATVALRMVTFEQGVEVKAPFREWQHLTWDPAHDALLAQAADRYPEPPPHNDGGALTQHGGFGYVEPEQADTFVALASDMPLTATNTLEFHKLYTQTTPIGQSAAMFVLFGHEREAFLRDLAALRTTVHAVCDAVHAAHHARQASRPQLTLSDPAVQSLLTLAPAIIDALKVTDLPGGMRASGDVYWIWGWDSLVHAQMHLFWQDAGFVRAMLNFYRTLADPRLGIFHNADLDGKPMMAMAFSAQCLYVTLLYHYFAFTHDQEFLREYYPFAQWIIERAAETEAGESGLLEGPSLYPDFPEHLGHDGHDLSVFNNGIYYQALRVMTVLAQAMGDTACAETCDVRAQRCLAGFRRHFYDAERGYFVDSVSSVDFTPRAHYPVYAVLWVTPYAAELVAGLEARLADFMRDNLVVGRDIAMLPKWDSCFMRDGVQLGMYMPVVELGYHQLLKRTRGSLHGWGDTVAWYWQQHTLPEAHACEAENEDIGLDRPGSMQAFTAKGWSATFYHTIVGLDVDTAGVTISTPDGPEIAIAQLSLGEKYASLSITGQGDYIGALSLNGTPVLGTHKLRHADLLAQNTITIQRTMQQPDALCLLRADDYDVQITILDAARLEATITGGHRGVIEVSAPTPPTITVDGRPVALDYDPATHIARCPLSPALHARRVVVTRA